MIVIITYDIRWYLDVIFTMHLQYTLILLPHTPLGILYVIEIVSFLVDTYSKNCVQFISTEATNHLTKFLAWMNDSTGLLFLINEGFGLQFLHMMLFVSKIK